MKKQFDAVVAKVKAVALKKVTLDIAYDVENGRTSAHIEFSVWVPVVVIAAVLYLLA
jgi:hypothetical protein